ncbi:MAG: type VI secretion system tube protein Hcp [Gemmataceae bacterium]
MRTHVSLAAALAAIFLFAVEAQRSSAGAPAGGAFAYFLKLDGIPGDSTAEKHAGEFDVLSFSFGATGAGDSATGAGKAVGRTQIKEIVLTKRVGKASPKLFLSCASGQHIKSAVLTLEHPATREQVAKYTLTDVRIHSFTQAGAAGKAPSEEISLSFGKIEIEFRGTDAKGGAAPTKAGWDLRTNKGS